jgi:hypothetical protein
MASSMISMVVSGDYKGKSIDVAGNKAVIRVGNPVNWIKSKQSLVDINATIPPTFDAYEVVDKNMYDDLIRSIKISPENFEYRLQAD